MRLSQGCENALALWCGLCSRGFKSTAWQVHRWLSPHRTNTARTAPHKWRGKHQPDSSTASDGKPKDLPSALQLAWLFVQLTATLTFQDAAVVARVRQHADVAKVADLARRFTAIVGSHPYQFQNSVANSVAGRLTSKTGWLLVRANPLISLVGAAGFELATPCTPCKCATRLRYAPTEWRIIEGWNGAFRLRAARGSSAARPAPARPTKVPAPRRRETRHRASHQARTRAPAMP